MTLPPQNLWWCFYKQTKIPLPIIAIRLFSLDLLSIALSFQCVFFGLWFFVFVFLFSLWFACARIEFLNFHAKCLGLNEPYTVALVLLPPTRSGHIEFGSITESLLRFECIFKPACLPACLLYVDSVVSIEFIESCLCSFACACVCVSASACAPHAWMSIVLFAMYDSIHARARVCVLVFVRSFVCECVQQLSGTVTQANIFAYHRFYSNRHMVTACVYVVYRFDGNLLAYAKTKRKQSRWMCAYIEVSMCACVCVLVWGSIVSAATQFTVWVVMRLSI